MKLFVVGMGLILVFVGVVVVQFVISYNGMLIDVGGCVLYIFDKDEVGKSNCNGQCVVNWLFFVVVVDSKVVGDYSVVMCDDGVKQWVFKGKLFYYFVGDVKLGDVNGEGKFGVWYIVKVVQ